MAGAGSGLSKLFILVVSGLLLVGVIILGGFTLARFEDGREKIKDVAVPSPPPSPPMQPPPPPSPPESPKPSPPPPSPPPTEITGRRAQEAANAGAVSWRLAERERARARRLAQKPPRAPRSTHDDPDEEEEPARRAEAARAARAAERAAEWATSPR